MKTAFKQKKFFLSNKGSLSLQFLLNFVLCFCFIMFFAVMSLTIAVASITQYITYSSARQLFFGADKKGTQEERAKDQYKKLAHGIGTGDESFKHLFNSTGDGFSFALFEVAQELVPRTNLGLIERFKSLPPGDKDSFYGVYTEFTPKVLEIETIFGNQMGPFKTGIGSYLGREPSAEECDTFNIRRGKAIGEKLQSGAFPQRVIDSDYQRVCGSSGSSGNSYAVSSCSDNGC